MIMTIFKIEQILFPNLKATLIQATLNSKTRVKVLVIKFQTLLKETAITKIREATFSLKKSELELMPTLSLLLETLEILFPKPLGISL
jgi:hypothetical protein